MVRSFCVIRVSQKQRIQMKKIISIVFCLSMVAFSSASSAPLKITVLNGCTEQKIISDQLITQLESNLGATVEIEEATPNAKTPYESDVLLLLTCEPAEDSKVSKLDAKIPTVRISLRELGFFDTEPALSESVKTGRCIGACTSAVARFMGMKHCPNPLCALAKDPAYAGSTLCPPCQSAYREVSTREPSQTEQSGK